MQQAQAVKANTRVTCLRMANTVGTEREDAREGLVTSRKPKRLHTTPTLSAEAPRSQRHLVCP
eukprot:4820591-Amphidinium_carterae.2